MPGKATCQQQAPMHTLACPMGHESCHWVMAAAAATACCATVPHCAQCAVLSLTKPHQLTQTQLSHTLVCMTPSCHAFDQFAGSRLVTLTPAGGCWCHGVNPTAGHAPGSASSHVWALRMLPMQACSGEQTLGDGVGCPQPHSGPTAERLVQPVLERIENTRFKNFGHTAHTYWTHPYPPFVIESGSSHLCSPFPGVNNTAGPHRILQHHWTV